MIVSSSYATEPCMSHLRDARIVSGVIPCNALIGDSALSSAITSLTAASCSNKKTRWEAASHLVSLVEMGGSWIQRQGNFGLLLIWFVVLLKQGCGTFLFKCVHEFPVVLIVFAVKIAVNYFWMQYRLLCIDVQREGVKPSSDLASKLFCYAPCSDR